MYFIPAALGVDIAEFKENNFEDDPNFQAVTEKLMAGAQSADGKPECKQQ